MTVNERQTSEVWFEGPEIRTTGAGRTCKQPRLGPVGWVFQRYADGSFIALPYGLDSTLEKVRQLQLAKKTTCMLMAEQSISFGLNMKKLAAPQASPGRGAYHETRSCDAADGGF